MEAGNPPETCPIPTTIRIGVLALQGSFREHMALLHRIPGIEAVEIRTSEELRTVAGLIIPGELREKRGKKKQRFPLFCSITALCEESQTHHEPQHNRLGILSNMNSYTYFLRLLYSTFLIIHHHFEQK